MKAVEVKIVSRSPYSQSRMHASAKLEKESHDAYEQRTWREKCNFDQDGIVYIPAMAFKQALDTVAKRLGEKTTGKGTLTKHFVGGVVCAENASISFKKDEAPPITILANSDGIRGSGKRVPRTFPQWPSWEANVTFWIMDETVTNAAFERHLKEAGKFIGIGRFRPEKGGLNGRFEPVSFNWTTV